MSWSECCTSLYFPLLGILKIIIPGNKKKTLGNSYKMLFLCLPLQMHINAPQNSRCLSVCLWKSARLLRSGELEELLPTNLTHRALCPASFFSQLFDLQVPGRHILLFSTFILLQIIAFPKHSIYKDQRPMSNSSNVEKQGAAPKWKQEGSSSRTQRASLYWYNS